MQRVVSCRPAVGVGVLEITNRQDCCKERLGEFTVYIGNSITATHNTVCATQNADPAKVFKLRVTCQEPVFGRYVFILLPGAGRILNLANVEVFQEQRGVCYKRIIDILLL